MKISFLLVVLFAINAACMAQGTKAAKNIQYKDTAYYNVVSQRADKIVDKMDINNTAKKGKVSSLIAQQYYNLNEIYKVRDEQVKEAKASLAGNKAALDAKLKGIETETRPQLDKLHKAYITKLQKELSPSQVDEVKDGMTYGVLPITYKGYQDMLPNLTKEQKAQILSYLTEAREYAMDAESSEKKHGWFGKYKGKINNYLSAAGYDMNKASKEWQERIRAASNKN